MSTNMTQADMNRIIERTTERLPRQILVKGLVHKLEVSYMLDTVDRWYLGYSSQAPYPEKNVFMFYEETTLDKCVFKAWRHLAEHKDEWKFFEIPAGVES